MDLEELIDRGKHIFNLPEDYEVDSITALLQAAQRHFGDPYYRMTVSMFAVSLATYIDEQSSKQKQ